MTQYKSPNGSRIIGTKELVPGLSLIDGISDDGTPNYCGQTDLDWNCQTSVRDAEGNMLFVDEKDQVWTFSQLLKVEG